MMQPPHETSLDALSARAAGTATIGDLPITRMAFGTMRLPGPDVWGYPADPEAARHVLRRAVELGVTYLDTAAYYGPLVSDQLIVEALYPYPEDLVIGTKVGGWRGSDKRWTCEAQPNQLRATIEDSLTRLRVQQLHLVHFRHIEHSDIPLADSLGVMADLQREGKIRHVGVSNVTLQQVREAQQILQVASVQNLYNLVDRRDQDVLTYCNTQGIPYMPFFPLAVGNLGQASRNDASPLLAIAERHAATPSQIALAWLLALSPQVVLIPGTGSVAHLEENIVAATIQLSAEEVQALTDNTAAS